MSIKEKCSGVVTIKYIIVLVVLILITVFVNLYVAGFAIVRGPSMEPTIASGDVVLVNKLSKNFDRFDIVIINTPKEQLIKRIIALPGETVQIKEGYVYVNGKQIDDVVNGEIEFAGIASESLTLEDGEYFVLGDNRANSKDSRYEEVGIIKKRQIFGKIVFK